MRTEVVTVTPDLPIYEAVRILVENNVTGLPVVNEDMTVAGILSEKDVLSLLYNSEERGGKVRDFMTQGVVSFDQEESLIDIAQCLIEHSFRRVIITSHGKLVGIISRKDIVAYILRLRRKEKKAIEVHG